MLKIAHIASEVSPYSKTGGLADVTSSLPIALRDAKTKNIIITPFYEQSIDIDKFNIKCLNDNYTFEIDKKNKVNVSFWQAELKPGLPVYFIGNEKYFSRHKKLYGSKSENARFYLFDKAVLELLKFIKFKPDILHCHDWQTGLIPGLVKKNSHKKYFSSTSTIFTIHNLAFQLGHNWWEVPNEKKDCGKKAIPFFDDKNIENINFAKRAILSADMISAVSEQYAKEILTPKFGQDLNRILNNRRKKIIGITNGINYEDFNPATDLGLAKNYDYKNIFGKKENKTALQKFFGLPVNSNIPLITMICRISEQKGFDVLLPLIPILMGFNTQLVIFGGGDKSYEHKFKQIMNRYPEQFAANLEFDTKHATLVYAGSDMTLIPSRFEPCGLTQMIALRYGSIPIVHYIGGLIDTIDNFDPSTGKGSGFVFKKYSPMNFLVAIARALENYKYKNTWNRLIKKGMQITFDWKLPAQSYLKVYNRLAEEKRGEVKI
ncbi:MAG: glycogen/starch synthase [bacterium]